MFYSMYILLFEVNLCFNKTKIPFVGGMRIAKGEEEAIH